MEADIFKESFKFFKKLPIDDVWNKAVDLSTGQTTREVKVLDIPVRGSSNECAIKAKILGLKSPQEWTVYELKKAPGLLVVPNPFLPCGQHHWVKRCLVDYPLKPNICNLDAHMTRYGSGQLWPHTLHLAAKGSTISVLSPVEIQHLKSSNFGEEPVLLKNQDTRTLACAARRVCVSTPYIVSESLGSQESQGSGTPNDSCIGSPVKKIKLSHREGAPLPEWLSKESMLYKLRWVTLGYHYDWNSKEYSKQNHSPFPVDLEQLSSFVLEMVGFPGFKAEAGIVNYYHLDSTLSGHTDHSEKDLTLPLLSISLGQSAVFLVGGHTKAIPPVPLLLNSGDIVIMSGESRLAYHGVPRVLPPSTHCIVPSCLSGGNLKNCLCSKISWSSVTRTVEQLFDSGHGESVHAADRKRVDIAGGTGNRTCTVCTQLADSWELFVDYLSVSRININVRQVVSESVKFRT